MKKGSPNSSLDIFTSPAFLISLLTLLANDLLLKEVFHNWFTGKLSDFAGLFVFPLFWIGLFPNYRKTIIAITALGFVYWKTPYADSFIELWNTHLFFKVGRINDYTDFLALASLPLAYSYSHYYQKEVRGYDKYFSQSLVGLLAVFAFCATGQYYPSDSMDVSRGQNVYCDQSNVNCKKKIKTSSGEEKYFLCDEFGNPTGDSVLYDEIKAFQSRPPSPQFLRVKNRGKFGVIDSSGTLLIPTQNNENDLLNGVNRTFHLISKDSSITIKIHDDGKKEIQYIEDSLTTIRAIHSGIYFKIERQTQADASYLIKLDGDKISPYTYFNSRTAIMELGWRGQPVLPYWYKALTDYSQRTHYTVVSPNGILLENISASELAAFKDFLSLKVTPKYGDKITLDSWLLGGEDFAFDEVIPNFADARDRIITVRDSLWGIMDTLGHQILPPKHQRIMQYSEEVAGFQSAENGRYGFLDLTGDEIISARYEYVGDFDFGLAPVQLERNSGESLFGYINKAGEFTIEPQFNEAFGFNKEGWALVRINDDYFYIDREFTTKNSANRN